MIRTAQCDCVAPVNLVVLGGWSAFRHPMVPADKLILIDQLQRELEPQWRKTEFPKGMNRLACQFLMASHPGRFVCCEVCVASSLRYSRANVCAVCRRC